VADLEGPDWLRALRTSAFERFAGAGLPTPEEEVWRYSRIAELDLEKFVPVPPGTGEIAAPSAAAPLLEAVGERAALVTVVDGRVAGIEVDASLAGKGLDVSPLASVADGKDLLRSVAGDPVDVFGEMNDAFAASPVLVRVPKGMVVRHPIVVLNWVTTDRGATFPRLVVQAGADSEFTVVDVQGSDDVDALVVPVTELDVGPAARFRYVNAQQLGYRAWQVGRQVSRVDRDATLVTANVALGGYYARLRIDSVMVGAGGTGDMLAAYFGEDDQMHDFRTLQDHAAPNTTSNLLFKGAVQDSSESVYTGLIRIEKDAAGVNAFQTNRNIKLSPNAWALSVPNLEIENNDVRCSHASTVGPIDEEQRFYLESRGVPPHITERLIVLGFFDEVLEKLPIPGAARFLRGEIARKFAGKSE